MKLLKAYKRSPGSGRPIPKEDILSSVNFHIYKFNTRVKPLDIKQILIITCFSEFGCETLGCMYGIPEIIKQCPGAYVICVGWFGREYLYRHLVDEYWELGEKYQWLREHTQAFKPSSKNIERLEKELERYGRVYRSVHMGHLFLGNKCLNCNNIWAGEKNQCSKCHSLLIKRPIFSNLLESKKKALDIPIPSSKILDKISSYLKPNSVGIFARNRVCYGRNLGKEFYIKLINYLESKGYNPIWLGEKQSVLPCPVNHIFDFSNHPDSRDLEITLGIISQLKFTVQFWTASTRLASIVKTPWILFESPDQIAGRGQEGKRIVLTTDYDKKKIVLSNYFNVLEDQDGALLLLDKAINEINSGNYDDLIGMVDHPEVVKMFLGKENLWR